MRSRRASLNGRTRDCDCLFCPGDDRLDVHLQRETLTAPTILIQTSNCLEFNILHFELAPLRPQDSIRACLASIINCSSVLGGLRKGWVMATILQGLCGKELGVSRSLRRAPLSAKT